MRADKDGLYAYGIMEESSDYHAHVCVQAGILVWCRTRDLQEFHERHGHRYPSHLVGNPPTARGYRVPWVDIPCVRVDASAELAGWIHKDKTSSEKGRKAESVVVALLCNGAAGKLIEGRDAQIRGGDIAIIFMATGHRGTMQVKYDYPGHGKGIFIQTHESNPRSEI